jgi:hypothetical protein
MHKTGPNSIEIAETESTNSMRNQFGKITNSSSWVAFST